MIFITKTEVTIKTKTKKSDMGNTIQRKQATLYVNSECSDTLPWLKFILIKGHKYPHLSKTEFGKLSFAEKNIINKRFKTLFKLSKSEWDVNQSFYEKSDGKIIDCELCGKRHIDILSEIINCKNGKKLIIGSTCITKFGIRGNKEFVENRQKEKNKLRNEDLIEKKTPGIIEDLDNFYKIKRERKVILRTDIKQEYDKTNYFIKVVYDENISNKKLIPINFQQIINLHCEVKKILDKINIYIEESKKDIWGINKEIAYWCYESGDDKLIKMLEQAGKITIYTVDQIKESNFIKKVILMFERFIKEKNMHIYDKLNIGSTFQIVFSKKPNIIIDVQTFSFIKKYKNLLFERNNVDINGNDIIQISSINNSSLENALKYICRDGRFYSDYMRKFDNINTNELVFFNKLNKKIYIVDYNNFIQNFKMYILKESLTKNEVENVKIYIQKNGKEYTTEQYKDHLEIFKGEYNKRIRN